MRGIEIKKDMFATIDDTTLERIAGGNTPPGPDGYRKYRNPLKDPKGALADHNHNLRQAHGDVGQIAGEVANTPTGASYLRKGAQFIYDWTSPVSWTNYFVNGSKS